MYVIIVVVALFIGFASYFFLRNNETITCTIATDKSVYVNVDDAFDLPIVWTRKNKYTTLDISVPKIANESVLEYDEQNQMFTAKRAGLVTVTITPSNSNFGPFKFNVFVGDGNKETPYYIKSASQLNRIGRDTIATSADKMFKVTDSYQLIADIDLTEISSFAPIGSETEPYDGSFNGDGYSIHGLSISENAKNVGLFAVVGSNATVENFNVVGAKIDCSADNLGVVAGVNNGFIGKVQVKNATVKNDKATSNNGGLVGLNAYSAITTNRATVQMCSATADFNTSGYTGGLIGKNLCSVVFDSYSYVTGYTMPSNQAAFGALIGYDESISYNKNVIEENPLTNSYQSVVKNAYTSSVIKNCYAVLGTTIDNLNDRCAGFIGKFSDEEELNKTSYYFNNYYSMLYPENANVYNINKGMATDAYDANRYKTENMISYLIYGDMKTKENFKGWFDTKVWLLEDGDACPKLNIDAMYSKLNVYDNSVPISSSEYLLQVFDIIRNYPDVEQTFIVNTDDENNVLDLEGAEFATIAPNIDKPMKASILVAEGKKFTIKNFKLSGANHSFFGYISTGMVRGFTFKDATVTHSTENGGSSAVVATDLLAGATLENCRVVNSKITANSSSYVGMVAAKNTNGKLQNCSVDFDTAADLSVLHFFGGNVVCGGIVGYNASQISGGVVNYLQIKNNANGSVNVGGAVGYSEGYIENVYVRGSVAVKDLSSTKGSAGGFAGFVKGTVTNCLSIAVVSSKEDNTELYTGGFAGYLAENSTITRSFYGNADGSGAEGSSVSGYWVAGFVCESHGTITESYTKSVITGQKAAGLVVANYGTLENCGVYDGTILVGTSTVDGSALSGICSKLKEGSYVNNCFSSAKFTGDSFTVVLDGIAWFSETESEFRIFKITKLLMSMSDLYHFGTWGNNIVINYGEARRKIGPYQGKFFDISADQCKGRDNFAAVIDAGFKGDLDIESDLPWFFPSFEENTYMYLRNVVSVSNAIDAREVPAE